MAPSESHPSLLIVPLSLRLVGNVIPFRVLLLKIRRLVVPSSLNHIILVLLGVLMLVKCLLSHEIGVADRTVEHDNLIIYSST